VSRLQESHQRAEPCAQLGLAYRHRSVTVSSHFPRLPPADAFYQEKIKYVFLFVVDAAACRYNESCNEKYGRKTPHDSSAVDNDDDTKVQASSWVDTEDTYPIKPSGTP
jgi:hypothetical protein